MMSYEDFYKSANGNKIICFGAGKNAMNMLQSPNLKPYLENIIFFVDNNSSKTGQVMSIEGRDVPIFLPEAMRDFPEAVILIAPVIYKPILEQTENILGSNVKCYSWSTMDALGELSKLFDRQTDGQTRFILMNTPDYANLGDHAIAVAERAFIKENFQNKMIEIGSRLCHSAMKLLPHYINEKDILFITGGGYMGSLWEYNNQIILDAIQTFPNNPVIVFPQSVYYEDNEEGIKALFASQLVYNKHSSLLLCAREKDSYARIKKYYPGCKHLLIPDMVLLLQRPNNQTRKGIGVCMREDKEGWVSAEIIMKLLSELSIEINEKIIFFSNHAPDKSKINHMNGEKYVFEKLNEYSGFKIVITDRLHGMVFSVITSTPCIAFANSYHKNKSLYETWLDKLSFLRFHDNIELADICDIIDEAKETHTEKYDATTMRAHFYPLIQYIVQLDGVKQIEQ